jgi:hypothetical protein
MKEFKCNLTVLGPVLRIRDPGFGASLTPGSGIRISDPGSQTHIFGSLETIFWVKSSIIL